MGYTIFIKNMVCDRCKMAVASELSGLKIAFESVDLGEVRLFEAPDSQLLNKFSNSLKRQGFELIEDKTARIISQVKKAVVDYVHYPNAKSTGVKFSSYLTEFLRRDYHYLSSLFSGVEGVTIEQYVILQKIEKVKELLAYDELTLSEIAIQLNYSSVQHLSNQFKKITGLTPSHFKKIGVARRVSIDKI